MAIIIAPHWLVVAYTVSQDRTLVITFSTCPACSLHSDIMAAIMLDGISGLKSTSLLERRGRSAEDTAGAAVKGAAAFHSEHPLGFRQGSSSS